MRIKRFLLILTVAASAGCVDPASKAFSTATSTRPKSEVKNGSPQAEALRIVLQNCSDQIIALDSAGGNVQRAGDEPWWFDTKVRTWSIKRPFSPGFIDSTHWFDVEYRIDGKLVGSWSVDTRTGEVQRPGNNRRRDN